MATRGCPDGGRRPVVRPHPARRHRPAGRPDVAVRAATTSTCWPSRWRRPSRARPSSSRAPAPPTRPRCSASTSRRSPSGPARPAPPGTRGRCTCRAGWSRPRPRSRGRTCPSGSSWSASAPARPADLRRAGAALARATRGVGTVVTTLGSEGGPQGAEGVRALVEGYLLGSYRIPTQATGAPGPGPAERLVLLGPARRPHGRRRRLRPGRRARDLAGPRPREHAVQHQEPRLDGRARRRARRRRGPGDAGVRRRGARRRGLRRHPRRRLAARRASPGSSPSRTRPRTPAPRPAATSSSSARASPSTPAACPSSRARPWCR